jgi:DUF1009 family protein
LSKTNTLFGARGSSRIPSTVFSSDGAKGKGGIPFRIVVGASKRHHAFRIFANLLAHKGFSQGELLQLPLVSNEGTALEAGNFPLKRHIAEHGIYIASEVAQLNIGQSAIVNNVTFYA